MARRSALRASDADRERVAERLRHAAGEGRLLTEELEDRLGAVFSARTYGDLDAVVSDLPVPRGGRKQSPPLWARAALVLAATLAVLAVLAVVALVVLGIAGAWLAWVVLGWFFFGRRSRCGPMGHSRAHAIGHRCARAGARAPGGRTASL